MLNPYQVKDLIAIAKSISESLKNLSSPQIYPTTEGQYQKDLKHLQAAEEVAFWRDCALAAVSSPEIPDVDQLAVYCDELTKEFTKRRDEALKRLDTPV